MTAVAERTAGIGAFRIGWLYAVVIGSALACDREARSSGQMLENVIRIDAQRIAAAPETSVELVWSLGEESQRPEAQFGTVTGIAVDDAYRLYVLDGLNHEIRRFDQNGTFETVFGKRGSGPGELARPHGITYGNGMVHVMDRVLLSYDTMGNYISSTPPSLSLFDQGNDIHYHDGRPIVRRFWFGSQDNTMHLDSLIYVSYQQSDGGMERLFALPQEVFRFGGPVETTAIMAPKPTAAFSGDGRIFTSAGDSFHIELRSSGGVVNGHVMSAVDKVRTSKQDFEDAVLTIQHSEELLARTYKWQHMDLTRYLREGPRAKYRAGLDMLIASENGNLALRRPDVSARPYATYDSTAVSAWLILNSQFIPEVRFTLPTGFNPMVYRQNDLWGTIQMDDGRQVVRRYSIGGT